MVNWIEVLFWKFVKNVIYKNFGYCSKEDRDGGVFMDSYRCASCDASEVQDWITDYIRLIKKF